VLRRSEEAIAVRVREACCTGAQCSPERDGAACLISQHGPPRGGNVYAVDTAGLPLEEDPRMNAIFSPDAISPERLALHTPEGTYDPFGDEGNTDPYVPGWRRQ